MNRIQRADVFAALAELSQRYPHWRLGQLIANIAGWADTEVWDVEDEQLLCAAREHIDELAGRNGVNPKRTKPLHLSGGA